MVEDLAEAVAEAGRALGADRCWLYARDPVAGRGVALVRWLRADDVRDVPADLTRWSDEPAGLAEIDPLFARALAGEPADFVEDVAAAPVNRELEAALGHVAFAHVNLHVGAALWGVLQPGMTGGPRAWTTVERTLLVGLRPVLAPLVAAAGRADSRLLVG